MRFLPLTTAILGLAFVSAAAHGVEDKCIKALVYPEPTTIRFEMPGLQIASLTDQSLSTGATLFHFPQGGATVNFDARGGSIAASETTLLSEGSYSNNVDGILFTGGSTMGLAAGDGVRRVLFERRAGRAGEFDFIPSVPTAVVYDFGGRVAPTNNPLVYPDHAMGVSLMSALSNNEFQMGRAGAGITTTVNKIASARWGGQGAAFGRFRFGNIFVAVVLNSVGDIRSNGQSITEPFPEIAAKKPTAQPGQNTTLSIIVTDAKLSRNQLKRLSVMVHTSMANSVHPFHTYYDGDINFAASLNRTTVNEDQELELGMAASELMKQAMEGAVRASNRL